MTYAEAIKKVQAKKVKENFMVVQFGYNVRLVLPFKDGLAFMAALNAAEQFDTAYGDATRINSMEQGKIQSDILSAEEYERFKIAALLNVTPEEVKQYALEAA